MIVRLFAALLLTLSVPAIASTVERHSIAAPSLGGGALRLPTQRNVSVYLPDGYSPAGPALPVIYYLSSFFEDDRPPFDRDGAQALFDQAIRAGRLARVIVVTADFTTPMGGSWYVDSSATGNWDAFMIRDLVPWVDAHYRTLAASASRGVAGDRMGGHGAIRFGMRHPETSGAVYALHPIGTGPGLQTMFSRPNWQLLQEARLADAVKADGFSMIFTSIFEAFLPDPNRPPLFFTPPARLSNGGIEIDAAVAERLNAAFFLERQVAAHADNLKKLRGFMFDWGRGDPNADHVVSNQAFTRTLDAFGVPYEAEEYRGGFGDRNWGRDGRIYTEMLPFFARTLVGAAPIGPGVNPGR